MRRRPERGRCSVFDDGIRKDVPSAERGGGLQGGADARFLRRRPCFTPDELRRTRQLLQLLAVCYFITAMLLTLSGALVLLSCVMQAILPPDRDSTPTAPETGAVIVVIGLGISVSFWALALCASHAGVSLSFPKNRRFCLVVAAVLCLLVPLGTILG